MSRGQRPYLDWSAIGRSRQWLDYGLLCMYESSAMILVGADSFVFSAAIPPLVPSKLTWSDFEIHSPISGGVITVRGNSIAANDGNIIYISNVEHPFKDEYKSLSVGAPQARSTRKPTNLFLGVIADPAVHLFPSGGGSGTVLNFCENTFIPVEDGQDGTTPPAELATISGGKGTLRARKFSGTVDNDLILPWEVPGDIVVDSGITFRVLGVFPDAGMTAEKMVFALKGYAISDNDPIDASWGVEKLVSPGGTYLQYDRLVSAFSSQVTVSDLAKGALAMLHFERQATHPSDTYTSAFGVSGIKIHWLRKPAL